jgi:hypothetical protein
MFSGEHVRAIQKELDERTEQFKRSWTNGLWCGIMSKKALYRKTIIRQVVVKRDKNSANVGYFAGTAASVTGNDGTGAPLARGYTVTVPSCGKGWLFL